MHSRRLVTVVFVSLSVAAVCQTQSGHAPPGRIPLDGNKVFQSQCARCHGNTGRGIGEPSIGLRHAAPDLTGISRQNHGKFPYREVKNFIEGIQPRVRSGEDQEMPVWGPIFHEVESDQDWGEVRLDAVTRYIESIQQK